MPLDNFHPAVGDWFRQHFAEPTDCQRDAWPAIQAGHHALIAAPTGSGKTLAAFLAAINALEMIARDNLVSGDELRTLLEGTKRTDLMERVMDAIKTL